MALIWINKKRNERSSSSRQLMNKNHEQNKVLTMVSLLTFSFTRPNLLSVLATLKRKPDELLAQHVARWNEIWMNGQIEVQSDNELQRQINAAWYYILSSLPALHTRSDKKQFYGLSPGSLSRGGLLGEDYGGHSFWDTETWMYPPVLLMQPTSVEWIDLLRKENTAHHDAFRFRLAKEILSYRIALRDAAADNAKIFGYEGWR